MVSLYHIFFTVVCDFFPIETIQLKDLERIDRSKQLFDAYVLDVNVYIVAVVSCQKDLLCLS